MYIKVIQLYKYVDLFFFKFFPHSGCYIILNRVPCVYSSSLQVQLVSSVTQSCLTLWDPMVCSMPGFPVLQYFPELLKLMSIESRCHPTISSSVVPFSSHLQSFPTSGSFQMSQFFASGGQSIGVSASASVLSMNIQHWFPLGWTGWISLQSKGLSRVFSNTTVQKNQIFYLSFLNVEL